MEIQFVKPLRHRAFDAAELSHAARLDGSLSLLRRRAVVLRQTRTSIAPFKAPSSRGGCTSASVCSSDSCSSCGKPNSISSSCRRSSRRKAARVDAKRANRREWTLGVIYPPSVDLAIADKGEDEKDLEESSAEQRSGRVFDCKSNWYAVIAEQDWTRPCHTKWCIVCQILGRKAVIWYERNSAERKTFADVCPHRLAPLSEVK